MKNMYFFKWLWNNIEVDKVFSWHTFAPQWIYTDLWQIKSAQFYLVGVKIWYSSFDPALILPDSSVSSRGSTTFNSTVPDILLACIVLVYFINTFFFSFVVILKGKNLLNMWKPFEERDTNHTSWCRAEWYEKWSTHIKSDYSWKALISGAVGKPEMWLFRGTSKPTLGN